jgi:hypothetical protein
VQNGLVKHKVMFVSGVPAADPTSVDAWAGAANANASTARRTTSERTGGTCTRWRIAGARRRV